MTEQELKDQIAIVAAARNLAKAHVATRTEAVRQFQEEHKILFDLAANAIKGQEEAEAHLRTMTLQAYLETGNKQPCEGVAVRILTKLDYNPETAFEWAVNHKMALKLDVTAFEKIAKASPLEFVTSREEAQATIAANLEKEEKRDVL